MEFLALKSKSFGLDISDLSLKIISLKKKGKFLTLASFGEEKLPPGLVKEGEIRNEVALAKIIKNALTKVKGDRLKTKHVVASLPEEKAFLQVIQMPPMSQQDLKSAVIYEAENYIPLPIQDVYLDSQIVRPVVNSLDHFDVLMAALPKKTVDTYLSCLKKAGLFPRVLEIESLAVSRALVRQEISPYRVLLLDLGETRTNFIIFAGYSLRFTASIPVAFGEFTKLISETLSIDFQTAEKLKLSYGLESRAIKVNMKAKRGQSNFEKKIIESGKIFEALTPALSVLVGQIKKYLDYYQTHASHEHLGVDGSGVSKILLAGGGANLRGLADFLSSELKIPTELGNPWVNILPQPLKEIPSLPFEESLKYTSALGLALRGIREND